MARKLKWKVGEAPTGAYRSFFDRAWPQAYLDCVNHGPIVFAIKSASGRSYSKQEAEKVVDGDIAIQIAVWRERKGQSKTFDWRRMKVRFSTLADAKAFCQDIINSGSTVIGDVPGIGER